MLILRLAIASPLRRCFDYLPPQGLKDDEVAQLRAGIRVLVNFGKRELCGILIEVSESTEVAPDKLKPALKILDQQPLLCPTVLQLSLWAADYYQYALGEVLSAMLPVSLRSGRPHVPETISQWVVTTHGKGLPTTALSRAPRQAEILKHLLDNGPVDHAATKTLGFATGALRELAQKQLIEKIQTPAQSVPPVTRSGPTLTAEQHTAVQQIKDADCGFQCWLLDGITGSGKTEVYFRVIELALQRGQQVLVLIPEIGLSPQTVSRFRDRFEARIEVLHSGLAEGARTRAWEAARSGLADIVIGTRSAALCPLARPGLIVIDEEHDSSYKQQDGFRYSARDIAIKRAQLHAIPIVLGSATPSLETLANALRGRYQHLRLRQRASASTLPSIETVDVRKLPLTGGLGDQLLNAAEDELSQGNQVLLFLNRRGYAPTLQCHDCGYIAECNACDARMTLHQSARELRCHHCEARQPCPPRCPVCRGRQLVADGVGTEQAEQVLRHRFSQYPVYRVDRDSMQRQGAMAAVVTQVNTGEPCLLLGTQMLTKGHHFPGVTLVGLLNTDSALFSADFRGPERMGQLLTQVAGRAGRADKPGRVLLQTHYPDHPLLNVLREHGYEEFAQQLLEERRQTSMPPWGQLILLRAEARDMTQAEGFLLQLRQHCEQGLPEDARFIGPLPAPMQRRKGRYRAQLMLCTQQRRSARALAKALVARAEQMPEGRRLRWSIDIDPQDMV